jgi:hypothetical protein
MKELNNELNRIVDVIVNDYRPEKIILFGSLANDDIHNFSDIDLPDAIVGMTPMGLPNKGLAFEALNNAKEIIQFCKSKMGY